MAVRGGAPGGRRHLIAAVCFLAPRRCPPPPGPAHPYAPRAGRRAPGAWRESGAKTPIVEFGRAPAGRALAGGPRPRTKKAGAGVRPAPRRRRRRAGGAPASRKPLALSSCILASAPVLGRRAYETPLLLRCSPTTPHHTTPHHTPPFFPFPFVGKLFAAPTLSRPLTLLSLPPCVTAVVGPGLCPRSPPLLPSLPHTSLPFPARPRPLKSGGHQLRRRRRAPGRAAPRAPSPAPAPP